MFARHAKRALLALVVLIIALVLIFGTTPREDEGIPPKAPPNADIGTAPESRHKPLDIPPGN